MLPVLIHGDAAFAGQGVVAETLNLSHIKGYRVGGTIHLIINNQLGFTTPPDAARSSEYSTDVAKMVQAPIFHVNGDDPEACVRVARLAFAYRQAFNKDVVIDMVCYRRHGHNEGDDPSYTQPLMYKRIDARRSVRKLYTEALVKRGDITLEEAEAALDDFQRRLQTALDETRSVTRPPSRLEAAPAARSSGVLPHARHRRARRSSSTRVYAALEHAARGLHGAPEAGQAVRGPRRDVRADGEVDWALGEAFAFGSLLARGHVGPAVGPGLAGGARSRTATRRWSTTRPATSTCRCRRLGPRRRRVLDLRLAALGVRRARLRVRLLGRRTRTPSSSGRRSSATS